MARLDVRTIKKLSEQGLSVAQIAEKYGVSRQAIYQKLRRDNERKGWTNNGYLPSDLREVKDIVLDPVSGYAVGVNGRNRPIVGRIGDERVTTFVQYHMDMLAMRQGVDKRDVEDLYRRFYQYLSYCAEHTIVPNNMNCYFALGITRDDMSKWRAGVRGTPEHKEFAETIQQFFASVHEQGATDGVMNPISSMFWQKTHDHMVEASKLEVTHDDPLGDRKSATELSKLYESLPD